MHTCLADHDPRLTTWVCLDEWGKVPQLSLETESSLN
jgi:hypothetical protein